MPLHPTRIHLANRIIGEKASQVSVTRESQRKVRLVIVDFGFHDHLLAQVSSDIAECYLDPESAINASALNNRMLGIAQELATIQSRFVDDKKSLVSDEKYLEFLEQFETLSSAKYHGSTGHFIAQAPIGFVKALPGSLNMAPHVDVRLLHLQVKDKIDRTTFTNTHDHPYDENFSQLDPETALGRTPNYPEQSVIDGLDRVILACQSDRPDLQQGDVVVLPQQLELEGSGEAAVQPLHTSPEIEERIETLTNVYKLIVVIPAGNTFLDSELGMNVDIMDEDWCPSMLVNAGTTCGAIVVAQDGIDGRMVRRKGYRWIDAFLDVDRKGHEDAENSGINAKDFDMLRKFTTLDPETEQPRTSASAVAVAAIIATVQQARRLSGLEPLKPYEARAHLRQWVHPQGDSGRKNAVPDAIGWLLGTRVIKIAAKDAPADDPFQISRVDLKAIMDETG